LAQHHKYAISEIESWIVFERDIYVEMLVGYLREQEERQKQQAN